MSDWIKKYRPYHIEEIHDDLIFLAEAPLMLLNIQTESDLGFLLIKHRWGHNDKKEDVFSSDVLIDNWVKKICADDLEVLDDIKNNMVSFVKLFKQYLNIYNALRSSSLLVSPNTIIKKRPNTTKNIHDIFFMVTELIAWADTKGIEVSRKLRSTYAIKQTDVALSRKTYDKLAWDTGKNFIASQKTIDITPSVEAIAKYIESEFIKNEIKGPSGMLLGWTSIKRCISGIIDKPLKQKTKKLMGDI